ncbi:ATP-binding protein [Kineococcus gynurae]|uniref:ATP-binding protein n=1 Tax=Kineococcus gynurae TaxID=452979 RepID=A0ABV5LSU7_9ACTN
MSFEHDPASVPQARHVVRRVLDGVGLDEMATAEIEIVVSEIVGNAIRHARPLRDGAIHVQCHVRVEAGVGAGTHVEIAVTDGGAPGRTVRQRTVDEGATGGRGLAIVDGLADRWGVVENLDDLSRTVWASFVEPPTRDRPL